MRFRIHGIAEVMKAISRRDNATISMFDFMGGGGGAPQGDPTHGGKLHQETRTDAIGRTQTRYIATEQTPTETERVATQGPESAELDKRIDAMLESTRQRMEAEKEERERPAAAPPPAPKPKRNAKPRDPDDPPEPPPDIEGAKPEDDVWWVCQRGQPFAGPFTKARAEAEHASIRNVVQKRQYHDTMVTADSQAFRRGLAVAPKGKAPPGVWGHVFRGFYQKYGYSAPYAADLYEQATGTKVPRPDLTHEQLKRMEGVRPARPEDATTAHQPHPGSSPSTPEPAPAEAAAEPFDAARHVRTTVGEPREIRRHRVDELFEDVHESDVPALRAYLHSYRADLDDDVDQAIADRWPDLAETQRTTTATAPTPRPATTTATSATATSAPALQAAAPIPATASTTTATPERPKMPESIRRMLDKTGGESIHMPGLALYRRGDHLERKDGTPATAEEMARMAADLDTPEPEGFRADLSTAGRGSTPETPTATASPLARPSPAQAASTREAEPKRASLGDPGKNAAKLRESADSSLAQAQEQIGRDRLVNTHRRARMAGNIVAENAHKEALARTAHAIADHIDSGYAEHLLGVRALSHIETLDKAAMAARREVFAAEAKAKGHHSTYAYEQEQSHRPMDPAHADRAKFPYPNPQRSHLRDLLDYVKGRPGTKEAAAHFAPQAQHSDYDHGEHVKTPEARRHLDTLIAAAEAKGLYGGHGYNAPGPRYGQPGYEAHQQKREASSAVTSIKERMADAKRLEAMGINDEPSLRAALKEYATLRASAAKPDLVKVAQRELIGLKFAGYFPTPPEAQRRVIALADIKPGQSVLEPSAGSGHLADAARAAGGKVSALEVQPALRHILELKGHEIAGHDALSHDGRYDRVVMNPPFEQGADMDHVRHAFAHNLAPGGKLVAIMGEGAFFRNDRKANEFRDWLAANGGYQEKLPQGSFARGDVPTGVNTRIVVLTKPGAEVHKSLGRLRIRWAA